jgi:hypothetical protein
LPISPSTSLQGAVRDDASRARSTLFLSYGLLGTRIHPADG